jgi:hypothetical protein
MSFLAREKEHQLLNLCRLFINKMLLCGGYISFFQLKTAQISDYISFFNGCGTENQSSTYLLLK